MPRRFLPHTTQIIGYARTHMNDDELRERLAQYLKGTPEVVQKFLKLCFYLQGEVSSKCSYQIALCCWVLADVRYECAMSFDFPVRWCT